MTTATKIGRGQVLLFPAGFSCPRDFDPVEFHRVLRQARKEAEADIERLLWFLDATEIDPDLEPVGDDEPDNDAEPSLGTIEAKPTPGLFCGAGTFLDQSRPQGSTDDREGDEHDGREPEAGV